MFVVEALGSADGMTAEAVRGLVVRNAADAAGVQVKDVPVLSVSPETIDGRPATTVVYMVKVSGLNVIYLNSIVTQLRRTVQVVSYGIGPALTEEMTRDHKEFVEAVWFK